MNEQQITLHDGRTLSYAEYGDPAGVPVILFHGLGSSKYFHPLDEQALMAQNVHFIVPNRPGVGASDRKAKHIVEEYAEDMAALDKTLHLGRFIALGWSVGAAYALACAYALPTHVSTVGIVGGMAPLSGPDAPHHLPGPWNRIALMTHYAPWMLRWSFRQQSQQMTADADAALKKSITEMSTPDRALMAQPEVFQMMRAATVEGYAHQGAGVIDDVLALAQPWGFALNEVQQRVMLWYGSEDKTWPASVGQHLADRLLDANLTVIDGAGQLLILSHWQSIMEGLLEHSATTTPAYV
ncbi:MAG: alpha/beta hydrolase [Anaerolineae bacterium]|nr:alpha/beta hydrolase [Anaerolineae bacterium]